MCPVPRYSYSVDPEKDSTAGTVLRLVGEASRVLELGPGPGTMTRLLQQRGCAVTAIEFDPELARHAEPYCERLIVADLENLDFSAALGEARFDAVIAADVLEHLRDPWTCLRRIREFIAPDGFLVVSIPNVAHAAVIAQLLLGRFPYTEQGLLDRTHLRFFSRHDVDDLLLSTGFLPTVWERNRVPGGRSEFAHAWQSLPAAVREALDHAREGDTYQYIVKALVSDAAGWAAKVRTERLEMEVDYQRLRTELEETAKYIDAFHEARDIIKDRDQSLDEVNKAFNEARDIIEDRDRALAEYKQAYADSSAKLHDYAQSLDEARKKLDEFNLALNEARDIIARLEQDSAGLYRSLARSWPGRMWKFAKRSLGRG